MSERLERAGRAVVAQPASSPLETAELERRVSRRRTRRAASVVACVAIVGLAGATAVALNGGDDDTTQGIVTDSDTTVPAPSGDDRGVLVRDGSSDEAHVINLAGEPVGTVALTEPLAPERQYFVHVAPNGDLELDTRDRLPHSDNECSIVNGPLKDIYFETCGDRIVAKNEDGTERQVVGVPDGETAGHWGAVVVSPDGAQLLAEFIGQCDDPATYFVSTDGSSVRGVTGPEGASAPVGWIDNESALVSTFGRCGQPFGGPAGAVVITPAGVPNVLYEVEHPDDFSVALWTRVDDAGTAATQRARETWVSLDAHNYSFDYAPRCFCESTPVHVIVEDERVISVRSLVSDDELPTANYAGIKQLIDQIADAERDRDAGRVDVLYDERGVPKEASIDTVAQAIDDEIAWTISGVTAIVPTAPTVSSTERFTTETDPMTVVVPNVLGLSPAAATSALETAGLVVEVQTEGSGDGPLVVVRQSPSAGERLATGSNVGITAGGP